MECTLELMVDYITKSEGLDDVVANMDKSEGTRPDVGKLHPVTYKNFLVEHGRMLGEEKTILHFIQVRCEPGRFMERLRRSFDGRISPKITYDSGVQLTGFPLEGVQDAFSVIWQGVLSDGMLGWIKDKVQELDNDLG